VNQGGVMTSVAEPVEHSSLLSVDNQRVIVDDTKQSYQQAVVAQSHSNGRSGATPVLPSAGSRVALGKRALWVLLVAAAVGTGVLLGHGLRVRGLGQAEENVAAMTQPQRSQDPPVLDAPLTRSRKPVSNADDGPEVIVRNFPQSPASAAATPQENVKAIFFDGDSSVVSGKYDITLQRIAELLDANPQSTAILEGHTDASGLESYNQELSMRRAVAVKDVLVEEYHIAASRLSTIGAGSATPLESNTTDSGRAYNRRVEVRIRQGSD
jgi:outer membrane protein OmpA-like peptidoglycan-associated protein